MVTVESVEDVAQIPDHHFDVGFSEYYMVDDEIVAVPSGTSVPDEWKLVCD